MAKCQCQPQFGCRPAGRCQCCHRPRPPTCPNSPTSARNRGCRGRLGFEPAGQPGACQYRPMARPNTGPACWGTNKTPTMNLPRRGLRSSLGVGPCIQDTEGRSRARAVHENKQDGGACNCRAATRHVQGEDTAIRKGQKSSSLPNFVSVDTGNAEPESCRGRQEWGWMKAANPHFIRKCASLLHHIYR